MTTPSLLMQQLQAQIEQFIAGGGQGSDVSIVAAAVRPANRGRGPSWCILVHTACGMGFEVPFNPAVDNVAVFLNELTKLQERPPAPDDARPQGLVLH